MKRAFLLLAASVALSVEAAELSVSVTNWVECVPVASATFPAGCSEVSLEWSPSGDGEFARIATLADPSALESWTMELPGTVVAQKRYYRLAMTHTGVTTYSDVVPFTRFRLISHDKDDLYTLATGVTTLLSAETVSILPFDGRSGTWPDKASYAKVGLYFKGGKRFIAGVRILPRPNSVGRANNRAFYASTDYASHESTQVQISYVTGLAANVYSYFPSTDDETGYECCWLTADWGNVAEMQVFGWDADDLKDASAGRVEIDFIPRSEGTNFYPVIRGEYPYGTEEAAIQAGKRTDGEFTDIICLSSPGGEPVTVTNTSCLVGQTFYYRLRTVKGGTQSFSTPKKFVRFRQLERDPDSLSVLRSGYSIMNSGNANNRKIFDGSTDTPNNDATSPVGVNFNEGVYVAGVRYYPRTGWAARLHGRYTYAYASAADYSSGISVPITPYLVIPAVEWRWFDSCDLENTYQYVTISPDSANLNEMEIYGWTEEDIEKTGDPRFPVELTAVNAENVGQVFLSWRGGVNILSYDIEYLRSGDENWSLVAENLDPGTESYNVYNLENGKEYTFRVRAKAAGSDGYSPESKVLVFKLVPGDGTGLSTVVSGPVSSRHLSCHHTVETRLSPTVDIYRASGSLFSSTNHSSALVRYRGKIVIPLSGTYTFATTVEGTDGAALYIDGVSRYNALSSAGYKETTVDLEEGEYDIALDYRSVNTVKSLSFTWALAGVWDASPVPVTQLKPLDGEALGRFLPDADGTYDGWDFAIPLSGYLSGFWRLDDGVYKITGTVGDLLSLDVLALFTRKVDGPFELTVEFNKGECAGRPSVFVSKSATSLAYNCVNFIYGGNQLGMKGGAGGIRDWGGVSWTGISGSKARLRLRREKDMTITFSFMDITDGEGAWRTMMTMPEGVSGDGWSLAVDDLYVGVSLFGDNAANPSVAVIRNLRLDLMNGTVILLR